MMAVVREHSGTPAELATQVDGPPPRLVEQARRAASAHGDRTPSWAGYVRTTRQAAVSFLGAGVVDSDQPAYLVVLVAGPGGDFRANRAPRGRPAPRGDRMALVVDAATLEVLDFGLDSGGEFDLALLGAAYRLPL